MADGKGAAAMKRKFSLPLAAGLLMLAFFLLIALAGPYFAPYDVEESKKIDHIIDENGNRKLVSSPFPPSAHHPFGTDKWGYDILTLLLHGAKYTVFTVLIVALLRLGIGAALGIFQGVRTKKTVRKKMNFSLFSGIPIFIIIYFIMLGINIEPKLSPFQLTVIQGALLIILGINGVYSVIFNKTIELREMAYVEASRTLGGTGAHLSRKHIFPALRSNLSAIFVNECIQVLHIIGQLGIFNLFLGGTEKQYYPTIYLSITNEWSGLIGQSRSFLYHSQWIILFPLASYVLLLLTFYLLSAGLKDKSSLNRPTHM
jgi:peptide/nickel transport system permease protein